VEVSDAVSGDQHEKPGDRVAIVVGAGSGQGRAIALDLATDHHVVLGGRRADSLDETAAMIGGRAHAVPTDATLVEDVQRLINATLERHGRIDILVNAQGVLAPFLPMDDFNLDRALEIWNYVYTSCATSQFLTSFAVMPHLTRPGGRIINITSAGALHGSPKREDKGIAYCAAKAALHGMTYSFALLLGREGITVNAIVPGYIMNTDMSAKSIEEDPELNESLVARIPVGRGGQPDEIAAAVSFLASPAAGFITGELLNVSGGMVLGR